MKSHFKFFLKAVFLVAVMVVGALAIAGQIDLYDLFIAGMSTGSGALAFAQTAFTTETATTKTMDEQSPTLGDQTISQKITEMKPSSYPMDTILRHIGESQKIESWEYIWYSVDQRSIKDTVKTTHAASGTSSPEGTLFQIAVNNIGHFSVDDNVMFAGIEGGDGHDLVCNVVAVDNTSAKIIVMALNGLGIAKRDIPEIASSTVAVIIGNAKSETDAQTTPYQGYPTPSSNYAQIHMAQVEQSFYEKLHKKNVNWSMNDYRAQAIYNMRRKSELTSLFGVKGKFLDPMDKQYKYMSAGITKLISKNIEYAAATFTNTTWAEWGRQIFTGNSGSDKRVLFAGDLLMKYMLSVPTVEKQIEAKQTEVVWGITFNKIDTGFGELLVKFHPEFQNVGWSEKGIVLDVNHLERATFKPLSTENLDLVKAGTKNVDAQVMSEAWCIATRYPDLHAIITKTS